MNSSDKVFTAIAALSLFLGSAAYAECTLNIPGPLMNSANVQHYIQSLREDSSMESGAIDSSDKIKIQTYGCEDTWGWKIEWLSNKPDTLNRDLSVYLRLSKDKMIPALDPQKVKEYQISEKWDFIASHLQKTTIKKSATEQSVFLCERKSTLHPKECAEPLTFSVAVKNGQIQVMMDFDDLEN